MMDSNTAVLRITPTGSGTLLLPGLQAIAPETRAGEWRLLDLEGVASGEVMGIGQLELERMVRESTCGLPIAWDDLLAYAESRTDLWSVLLVCTRDPVSPLTPVPAILEAAEVIIQRFDSGDWLIACLDPSLSARVAASLESVHAVRSESWPSFLQALQPYR